MEIMLEYIPLSTEEKRLLREYMEEDTEYTRQIRANRDRSLHEAANMHFRVTPTGFAFEMEEYYDV